MKLKKQKRSRKFRGSRYHGYAMKKHKGKGNRGGKGMAGSGKRADQKKTYIIKYKLPYFGKEGRRAEKRKKKKDYVNVGDVEKKIKSLIKKGIAKKGKKGIEVNLEKYKILGEGEVKEKLILKARGVSKKAREKIEKAGGKVVVLEKKKSTSQTPIKTDKTPTPETKLNIIKNKIDNKQEKKSEKRKVKEKKE